MQDIPTHKIERGQRIELFLELLKKQHQQFDNAREAHRHIRKALEDTERTYAECTKNMCMLSFFDFTFDPTSQIYYWDTAKHTIFINVNGSYGIYRCMRAPDELFDLIYKDEKYHSLVIVKSKYQQPLWDLLPQGIDKIKVT